MKLNLFLCAVLVALVAANLGLSDNPTRRNFEAMPEMVRTASYKAFSANLNFGDGKTLQLPPEGVVARRAAAAAARPFRRRRIPDVLPAVSRRGREGRRPRRRARLSAAAVAARPARGRTHE